MLLPSLFIIILNNEPEQSPALKPLLKHHLSYSPPYTFYEKVLPIIKWVRGEVDTFKHFNSWGYFENFPKTIAAMSRNHRHFMSQRVQFNCTIVRLWWSCHLLCGIYINSIYLNERVRYSHVAFMLSVGFLPHFSKIFCATFPPHWTHHLLPLDVWGLLRQNMLLHKMTGWRPVLGGGSLCSWSYKYNHLCTCSFMYCEEYLGCVRKFWYLAFFKECF